MTTEIKTYDWSNGQRQYETLYVNGKRHGLAKWWHDNGQKWHEVPYVNGQRQGLAKWQHLGGSLQYLTKWHQHQCVWEIYFSSEECILEDAEVELFFHQTPELS